MFSQNRNSSSIKTDSLLESTAFQKADGLNDKQLKLEAFKQFISDYPNSLLKEDALIELFSVFLSNDEIENALNYASLAVQSVNEESRIAVYSQIAFALAKKKAGLDTADTYARLVIEQTKTDAANYLKYTGLSYDTRALIQFDHGKIDSALILENQALGINIDNPSFLSRLAYYQETAGFRLEAIRTAAKAILLGNTDDALTNFDKWIEQEKPDKKGQVKLREIIADSTLKVFYDKSKRESKYAVNSTAAAFLALIRTNLKQSDQWNREALKTLNENSLVSDRILFNKNYGLIHFANGNYKESFEVMDTVKKLADLRDVNFWYTLGKMYEKVKDNQNALDAYISGSIVLQTVSLQCAIRDISFKLGISENKIQSLITEKHSGFSSFNPGNYQGKSSEGNVVLAELFTDAECPPCISADSAFEYISEYFPRNKLAILEYHLHISGPDPMSNPDTYKRNSYYGGNFGVPSVFIQGTARVNGGGPKELTKNKFEIYKYIIEKFLNRNSVVKLNGSAKLLKDSLLVNLEISKEKSLENNTTLHIAITEKSIKFPAGNGISNNIFVVRSLLNGAKGVPIKVTKGIETLSETINIQEIEKIISGYLHDPNNDATWTAGFRALWLKRMITIDRSQLAVVAWIQNNKTREVLQSIYLDVPAGD
jgi:tetratricopeptide (TPR) repeat protein